MTREIGHCCILSGELCMSEAQTGAPRVSRQTFRLPSSLQDTILEPEASKASAQTVEVCPIPGPASQRIGSVRLLCKCKLQKPDVLKRSELYESQQSGWHHPQSVWRCQCQRWHVVNMKPIAGAHSA